jgi:hypothetical protein
MRVQSEARKRRSLVIEEVEKDEGLENIAEVRWAHQARDGPVTPSIGLAGYPAGDFLQISRDVRELNPEAADLVRKLIDQTFAIRGDGRRTFQLYGVRNRNRCIPPVNKSLKACTRCGSRPSVGP